MSPPVSGWRPPLCDSRTGAAHARRSAPCQDASGVWTGIDAGGQAVQLLVVSDGHGGSRYDRSDVGSQLACRVALQTAGEWLVSSDVQGTTQEEWWQWLAHDLPRRIVERWRQQVLAHAEAHPRSDGAAASTLPYGATLGLLLLTPRWWGCTGLGDWDLVHVDGEGRGELVSEEPDTPGGGEATFSLCMESAERYFASRSRCQPIAAEAQPFALLLSTDGIRKSCGSDADYLTLAHYLCGLDPAERDQQPSELAAALDHISGQGSGDDVSVAVGRWGPLSDNERRPVSQPPRIVQPQRETEAGLSAAGAAGQVTDPRGALPAGGAVRLASAVTSGTSRRRPTPWLVGLLGGLALLAAAVGGAALLGLGPFARREPELFSDEQLAVVRKEAQQLCQGEVIAPGAVGTAAAAVQPAGAGRGAEGVVGEDPGLGPAPAQKLLSHRGQVSGLPGERTDSGARAARDVAGDAHAARPAVGSSHGAEQPGASEAMPAPQADGGSQASRPDPGRIASLRGNLSQRKPLFAALQWGTRSAGQALAQSRQDPLGTLVVWSALQPGVGPLANSQPSSQEDRGSGWAGLPGLSAPRLEASSPAVIQSVCPELREALRQQWQLVRLQPVPRPAAPQSAVPQSTVSPSAAPLPLVPPGAER